MRELVGARGAAVVFAAAGLAAIPLACASAPPRVASRFSSASIAFGAVVLRRRGAGARPHDGRRFAPSRRREARRCAAAISGSRPGARCIVTGLDRSACAKLSPPRSRARGFVLDPADPRLAIVACSGAPACAKRRAPCRPMRSHSRRSLRRGRRDCAACQRMRERLRACAARAVHTGRARNRATISS